MNNEPIKNRTLIWMAAILALGLLISMGIGAQTFYRVRSLENTLSVTGSARKAVRADQVKWTAQWSRIVKLRDLKAGYSQMAQDQEKVRAFLAANGIASSSVDISPVNLYQNYDYKGGQESGERDYNLQQTVQIQSGDVDKITAISKDIQAVVGQGVIFSTTALEYSYTKLPELRVSLLSDAIQDAKARAAKLAESSGRKVGILKSASMGVVQVLPVGSVEVSDYGAYDTSKIDKEVMVTVKAAFTLE